MKGLPAGPSRLRASDVDREQVVTVIRGHWTQGRLTDEELEQRLGRALSARTLGDLRGLVADLPPPPLSLRERAGRPSRYAARGLRTIRGLAWTAGAIIGGLGVLGVIVSDEQGTPGKAPVVQVPAPRPAPSPRPAPKITKARVGQVVLDDGIAFRVLRVRRAKTVPLRADRGGGNLAPGQNRRFVVADVQAVNHRSQPDDPFCGSGGAALSVPSGEDVEPIPQILQLQGNDVICSGGLAPGQRTTVQIVFRLPKGDRARQLDVWHGTVDGDRLGDTRIRVQLRPPA